MTASSSTTTACASSSFGQKPPSMMTQASASGSDDEDTMRFNGKAGASDAEGLALSLTLLMISDNPINDSKRKIFIMPLLFLSCSERSFYQRPDRHLRSYDPARAKKMFGIPGLIGDDDVSGSFLGVDKSIASDI